MIELSFKRGSFYLIFVLLYVVHAQREDLDDDFKEDLRPVLRFGF